MPAVGAAAAAAADADETSAEIGSSSGGSADTAVYVRRSLAWLALSCCLTSVAAACWWPTRPLPPRTNCQSVARSRQLGVTSTLHNVSNNTHIHRLHYI